MDISSSSIGFNNCVKHLLYMYKTIFKCMMSFFKLLTLNFVLACLSLDGTVFSVPTSQFHWTSCTMATASPLTFKVNFCFLLGGVRPTVNTWISMLNLISSPKAADVTYLQHSFYSRGTRDLQVA